MAFLGNLNLSTIFKAAAFAAVAFFAPELGIPAWGAQMAATFAVSIVASRIFAPNVPQAQNNNIRQQVPPDPTAGIPLVYGDAYTGARFCDAVLTSDQQAMYYVMVISNISPNGQFSFDTSKFYYQDQIITFDTTDLTKVISLTDGAGNVDTSISGHLYINLYTSSQSGTITPINSSNLPSAVMTNANGCPSGQEWPSTNRQMNGLAFAIVKLVYNNNSAGTTSLQPITFHVSHYLNNTGAAKAGDVWYDYLTNTVYGGAIDPSFVDSASATALNTYGDQLITYTPYGGGSASQPRYRFNGVLDTGQTVLSNIDIMMTCCDCWQSYQVVSGKWSVTINRDITPTFAFDDNNIIGNITASELDITQMVNQIEAKFNDSTNRDQAGYVNLQTPANLLYQNEPVNKFTVSYDLVNNSLTAQYLANRTLEQNREDLIVSFSTNYTGIQVNAGDVVTVTNGYYGWNVKQFRVMQVKEVSLPDGSLGAGIQLIEYNSAVYGTGDITQFVPAPNSGIPSPNYFSALAAPTVTGYPSAAIPHFDVSTYVPMVGRVTNGSLYYTTTPTPVASDYKLLTTAQTANSQPVTNNTFYVFANQSLPSGTYYFAYTVASESNTSPLSPLSSAFVWNPVGMSGASGASGYSGFSGNQGNSFRIAYLTQSQSAAAPSTPSPTSGSTSYPSGWSGTITTPSAGQSLYATDGTYVQSTNLTTWSTPYLTQGFPTTIQSDNYVLNTSGWQIQRNTGNAYFNQISARGDITGGSNITINGQAIFSGNNAGSSFPITVQGTTYSLYYSAEGISPFTGASPSNSSNVGLLGIGASTSGGSGSYNIGVVGLGYTGSGIPNSIGGFFNGTTFASYHQGSVVFDNSILYWNGTTVLGPPSSGGINYFLRGDGNWALISSITSGVSSFNTRTGAVTLTSGDVTGALGYTPYDSSNPSGFITNSTSSLTNYSTTSTTLSYLSANYTPTGYAAHQFNADSGTAIVSSGNINIYVSITGFQSSGSGNTITIQNVSDRNLKRDIVNETLGLDFVKKLNPVTYSMIKGNGRKLHGFIAQDVEPLIDGDNDALKITNEDGSKGVDYLSLLAPMVKAIQEMDAKIIELQAKIDTMTTK